MTDARIRSAIRAMRGADKPRKLTDGRGLFLLLKPNGSALWRFKYTTRRSADGKSIENAISLGAYPDVSLKVAREKHAEARALRGAGGDPSQQRKDARRSQADTFAELGEEYIAKQAKKLAPKTISKARSHLHTWINPHLGHLFIRAIKAEDLLRALRRIEHEGKTETAHKVKELCGRVYMFAIASGRADHNVAADLKLALEPRVKRHYPHIKDPVEFGGLLRAIEGYPGQPATAAALKLLPLVFLRQAEFRKGRWTEIDWNAAVWRVPAIRMKGHRGDHLVPLSKQSLAILRSLQGITGHHEFMFPAIGRKSRPISDGTLGGALRVLGYASSVHVPHGFRHTASTLMHELEMGLSADIELQLSHQDENEVRRTYNSATRLDARKKLMQKWADYLDALRAGGNVVPIKRITAA